MLLSIHFIETIQILRVIALRYLLVTPHIRFASESTIKCVVLSVISFDIFAPIDSAYLPRMLFFENYII